MDKIIIVGAGAHAECVIANIMEEKKFEIFGLLDANKSGSLLGFPILGKEDLLPKLKAEGLLYAFPGAVIGANGNTMVGKTILDKILAAGFTVPNLISSKASVRFGVKMGVGVLVQPSAVVDTSASLGNGVVVNPLVLVGHHCQVGDNVVFAGGVTLNARLKIGNGAFIGMGANVFSDVGIRSKVAPGTVVMSPVPDNNIAFGNPVRMMRRIE